MVTWMEWIPGVLVLVGLVGSRFLLRRWLFRRWLVGELTVNQMAGAFALTGGAGVAALVFGWEIVARGAPLWLMFFPLLVFLLVFPFARWVVSSFLPAPGSGNPEAASLLEESTLRHIHRDPD
jgi:hypothetical protein